MPDLGAAWSVLLQLFGKALEVRGMDDAPPPEERRIGGLADDSRRVEQGTLFFAVPGLRHDGAAFAAEAVARGACAVVAERALDLPVPVFVVPSVRRAVARLADAWYGEPSRRLCVVGVTGTNGKTTVTDLLSLCLEDDSRQVGSLGTIHYRLGPMRVRRREVAAQPAYDGLESAEVEPADDGEPIEKVVLATHTTPDPISLQRYLAEMVSRGVRAAVCEISSHALDQHRADDLRFDAAVFTNLTQDHLDYHGTMAAYGDAKARLFENLRAGALAVLPNDEPSAAYLFERLPQGVRLVTWGFGPATHEDALHVRGRILANDLGGIRLAVETAEGTAEVALPLVGEHNVRNALAALACAIGLGVGTLRAADAMSRARPVAGRLERVDGDRAGHAVFIDYAHTPDALRHVLQALRPMTGGSLRVVFGCGGNRDSGKRPQMGRIAAELADHVVVTDDNPRFENPELIRKEILTGIEGLERRRAEVEACADRRAAIEHVLGIALPGDTVVICGKGHERGQILGDAVLPFSDHEVVEEWLCSR
ncbi:MAG: UDP-N-acetylmuramoyl-L-alanyl-D-glutamate--2,6-diaminopimelate ligase [Planctomycetota bacterium]